MIGTYSRTSSKLLKGMPKAKPLCRVFEGRLYCGTKSNHKTKQGRLIALFWRIKDRTAIAGHTWAVDI